MKVLFITPAPLNLLPSQRFRFEQYLQYLLDNGIKYKVSSFWNYALWRILFSQGRIGMKIWGVFIGFAKRLVDLFTLHQYDFIYIHREAAPVGPPVFEWLYAKVWRKKIIYDFDDAIWINLASNANPFARKVKCVWKVKYICKWSKNVTVGNDFLAKYAKEHSKNVLLIPSVVDTDKKHNRIKVHTEKILTIGWTGTFTNFIHLPLVTEAIQRLKQKYNFVFLIIADKNPALNNVEYEFLKWNLETEIDDLFRVDIGIMPLIKTDVQLGKCSFKAIQYMSLGMPPVVSPVGFNKTVVEDGVDGFWADSASEWYDKLERLLTDKDLRVKMSIKARDKVINKYSVLATQGIFLKLFK